MNSIANKILWATVLLLALGIGVPASAAPPPKQAEAPLPVFAYYYIWFDHGSWDRAKTDYPLLGKYTSDDENVMRQHIQWAKEAGIDGFIVSWKSTERLNRRLEQLMRLSEEGNFYLMIIYQGLDFERDPLPVDQIGADMAYFSEAYAASSVFDLFAKPVVIWSGTWEFSREEIESVTDPLREGLYILGSERNLKGYERLAGTIDGNAYYWSSVNPDTFPTYQEKLDEMGAAAHRDGGIWIAPAAPGFDARLIGGTRVVERKQGETLLTQIGVAVRSSPDVVGLISWNEFSENSHIEPSLSHGMLSLETVADYRDGRVAELLEFDSDAPAETSSPIGIESLFSSGRVVAFIFVIGIVLLSLLVILLRGISSGRS